MTYHNPGWKAAWSLQPGGVNGGFGDGQASFVRDAIHLAPWQALSTRSGGEVISTDDF